MSVAISVTLLWFVGLCFHEFAHAIVAFIGGDKSVHQKGYLSLNPLKYIDPSVSIVLPTVVLLLGGLALPGGAVSVNRLNLRNRAWESMVSIAGPIATAIFAYACTKLAQMPLGDELRESFSFTAYLCCGVSILNLLPIPPLDGYGIFEPWLPKALQAKLVPLYRYGFWILLILLWCVPFVNDIVWGAAAVISMFLGINPDLVYAGDMAFRKNALPLGIASIVLLAIAYRLRRPAKPEN
jgi:Zn-dependent protease